MINVVASTRKVFSVSRSEFEAFCNQMGEPIPSTFEEFEQNKELFAAFRGFASVRLREGLIELEIERFGLENYPDR